MKRILAVFVIATVSLFGIGIAKAEDIVATWSMKDGPLMTIELQDQDNFRMNMGEDSYILMSQGKGYMVSKEKGEWVATSMEDMKKMMEMSGIKDLMSQMARKQIQDDRPPRFEKTGRVETIAGIKGQVYQVSMDNTMGKPETVEMVFGEDSRLLRLHQAQARWAESAGMMGGRGGPSYSELIKKYAKNGPGGAMLRYADVMKLESIKEANLASSRFRVPRVKEMDMGPMRNRGRQHTNQQGTTQPPATIDLEREMEKARMRRQAERRETGGAENQPAQDDVMEGVNSLLKGLFGN